MKSQTNHKVVFVVVDGMRDDTARRHFGYLEGLIEQRAGLRARVQSILPSMSRPCYEAIMTGSQPMVNGITGNDIVRLSKMDHLFKRIRAANKTSALVAYYWMSELFRRAPFDLIADVEQDHQSESFDFGRFYFEDSFPDTHAFALGENLRVKHAPDFLLIHPMGVDDIGHKFGSDAKEYQGTVAKMGMILARLLPGWLEDGYTVIVTADHGMNPIGFHGGTDEGERLVPFYAFGSRLAMTGDQAECLDQTTLAQLLCRLLDVPAAETMNVFPDELYRSWFQD